MTPLCPNVDHRHPSRHVLHDPWRQCQPPHDVVTPRRDTAKPCPPVDLWRWGSNAVAAPTTEHDRGHGCRQGRRDTWHPPCPQGGQRMTPLCPNVDHRHPSRHVLHDPWRQCQPPHDVVTPRRDTAKPCPPVDPWRWGSNAVAAPTTKHDRGHGCRQGRLNTSRPPCPYREASA